MASRISFEASEDTFSHRLYRDGSGASVASTEEQRCREDYEAWREEHPCLLQNFDQLEAAVAGKLLAVFLDYDGTLTPIVSNPDAAVLSAEMRDVVRRVAQLFPTAIVSGRGREKVEQFVQLQELYYAGSHGMDIVGPRGASAASGYGADLAFQPAAQYEPLMREVYQELIAAVAHIPGSSVENNKFCLSVHFRNCGPQSFPAVAAAVEAVVARHDVLRITRGRKVLEVRPHVDWDKGAALVHLLSMLGLREGEVYCLYIGDDRTDEDAFRVLSERALGGGILVSTRAKPTEGRWTLRDPGEVAAFLRHLVAWGKTDANGWHREGGCNGWRVAEGGRWLCGPNGIASGPGDGADGLPLASEGAALPAGAAQDGMGAAVADGGSNLAPASPFLPSELQQQQSAHKLPPRSPRLPSKNDASVRETGRLPNGNAASRTG